MNSVFLMIPLLTAAAVVQAEITYPVNIDEWNGRTAYLDMSTGQVTDMDRSWATTDPDNFTCPLCGVLPDNWPVNIFPLLQTPADPTPDYDSRITIRNPVGVVCGPDVAGLDPRCDGQTDQLKGAWDMAPRPDEERKLAAGNEAAAQTLLQMPEAKFRLHVLIQLGLNMMRLQDQTLPPKWQTVNDQHWTWLQSKVLPVWDRRKELLDAVGDGTIQGGDMDQGWPVVEPADLPE